MTRFIKPLSPATVIATVALFVALGGVAGALPGQNAVDNGDVKDLKYTGLDFKNTWQRAEGAYPPAAALDAQGVVHLRGAIQQATPGGSNFALLRKPFRPDKPVGMPVVMGGGTVGFVGIDPDGEAFATVLPGSPQSNAQAFTELDGVTYEAGSPEGL